MNNKLMKNIFFITLALIVFIILPFIYIKSAAQSTHSQPSQIQAEDGSTVPASFYSNQVTYTITHASNNEFNAQSTTDNTGLFFTQSDLINVDNYLN